MKTWSTAIEAARINHPRAKENTSRGSAVNRGKSVSAQMWFKHSGTIPN
jgi:hypothetical protein